MTDKFKELIESNRISAAATAENTKAIQKDTIARAKDALARGKGGNIAKPDASGVDLAGLPDLGKDAKTIAALDDIKGSLHTIVSSGVALKLQGLDLKDLKDLKGLGAGGGKFLTGLTDQSPEFKKTSDALADLNKNLGFKDVDPDKIAAGIKSFGIEGLGITTAEAVEKLKDLGKHSLTARNILASNAEGSEKAAARLAAFGAQAEKAGVDSETFGQALDTVNFDLGLVGKNGEGAEKQMNKMMTEALSLSKELNSPLGSTLKSLGQQFPELTVLGGGFVRNIKELSRAGQRAGVSLESLIGMSKKFETIEGASEQVGNLSAVLRGTNLDVGELISAEPVDRVKMVLKDIKGAMAEGRFELAEGGMERVYQVRALAKGAGIAENEMNRLLKNQQSVDELFKKRADAKKVTMAQNKEEQKAQMGATEKIKVPQTDFTNAITQKTGAQKKFNQAVAENSKIMSKNAIATGKAIADISSAVSAAKTAGETWAGKGAAGKGGLFGQLFFGRGELFEAQTERARGLTTDLTKLVETLNEQVERAKGTIQDAKDQQEGKAPIGQPVPGTGGTTGGQSAAGNVLPPNALGGGTTTPNQQITKQPNGDIKVQISQELVLPANMIHASAQQGATQAIR
jgi:hypothetical protein